MTKRQRKAKRQPRPLTRRQKIRKLTARLAQIEPVFKEALASRDRAVDLADRLQCENNRLKGIG